MLTACLPDDGTQAATSSSSRNASSHSAISVQIRSADASSAASSKPEATSGNFDPLASINLADVPAAHSLDVPFISQAPTADWTDALNEACEEASLYGVEKYLTDEPMPTAAKAEADLYAMIDWQEQNGYEWDMSAEEVGEMAQKYLKRRYKVYAGSDVTAANIRALIAAGHPVIIPAAGQQLGNPYFSGDGPPYHMLVITGYDSRGFITNDVGTKRGEDYRYSETTIMNSIHDWTGSIETITSGRKAILVVGK